MNESCNNCRFFEPYQDKRTGECGKVEMGETGDEPPFIKVRVLDDSGLWAVLVVQSNFYCNKHWPNYVNGQIVNRY